MAKRRTTRKAKEEKLPVVSAGRELSKKDKLKVAAHVCELYETDKYPLLECLKAVGIKSESTWFKWRQIEEIEELYKGAKKLKLSIYRHKIKERARTSLEQNLDYRVINVREESGELVNVLDKDGNVIDKQLTVTDFKNKQVVVRASSRLIEFALTNVDGENFTKNPEPHKAGNSNIPTKVSIEIVNDFLPPVTSEDDIDENIGNQ